MKLENAINIRNRDPVKLEIGSAQIKASLGKELHFSTLNRTCFVNKQIHIFSCTLTKTATS